MKLKMVIELNYNSDLWHQNAEEYDAFKDFVLNPDKSEDLILFSNFVGDEVGFVKVIEVLDEQDPAN